jgi:hypothetical protein
MGSGRRRVLVLVLGLVALALIVLFPFILPPAKASAVPREKARHLLLAVIYLLVIIFDLGAMALVAAREIRGVFDDYRTQRHNVLSELVQGVGRVQPGKNGNDGKPLE